MTAWFNGSQPKAGIIEYATISWSSVLKHYWRRSVRTSKTHTRFPYPEQVADAFIEAWRKHAVHIQKDRVRRLAIEFLSQEIDHGLELAGGGDLEDQLSQDWSRADGLEADGH